MKKTMIITFSLVFCLMGAIGTQALAFNSIGNNWAAAYPDVCQELQEARTNAQGCVLCHGGGSSLNAYGQDLADNNRDFAAIANFDSDGDGRTNNEEILNDCTLPGDQASPVDVDTWGSIKALFR
jgi:hypothetical protein